MVLIAQVPAGYAVEAYSVFENSQRLDAGAYGIDEVLQNRKPVVFERESGNVVRIKREVFESSPAECAINVILTAI